MLIKYLPPESATMTEVRVSAPEAATAAADRSDPAARPWSQDQMLLAAAVDTIRELLWVTSMVNSGDGARIPRPEPITRPGVSVRPRKVLTVAAYRAMTGEEPPLHLVRDDQAG